MLQPALRQIEDMSGETVQTLATMILAPFITEWVPSIPFQLQLPEMIKIVLNDFVEYF